MKTGVILRAVLVGCLAGGSQPLIVQASAQNKPPRPSVCEDALAMLENAALEAREDKESFIIVVARVGDGEKSRSLNLKRLRSAIPYLESRAGNKIVAASGEKLRGYGRLELYVSGKLLYVIAFPKNRLIDCSGLY